MHKKGSRKLCKNYGGTSLLSIPGKVFAQIPFCFFLIDARVCQVTEDQVMEELAGFRPGRGCIVNRFCEETAGRKGN